MAPAAFRVIFAPMPAVTTIPATPVPPTDGAWKRTVTAIGVSQFLSVAGFSFSMPFAPYYLQTMGVREGGALHFWVSLFGAALPLSMAISAPLWGILADRHGRRLMLLRANVAGAVVLTAMGLVASPTQLIVLRFAQGLFTGTITAAQALAAAEAPADRVGRVMGVMSAAVYSGGMAGAFAGGLIASQFGYRVAFFASGAMLVLATLLVWFGVTEHRVPGTAETAPPTVPAPRPAHSAFPIPHSALPQGRWARLRPALPLLTVIGVVALVRQFDNAWLPLLVQQFSGSLPQATRWTGAIGGACAGAGLLAGLAAGRLSDRWPAGRLAALAAVGAGLCMLPQAAATGIGVLAGARMLMTFCSGALEPILFTWMVRTTPEATRGAMFGLATTARCLGWIVAPLLAGLLAEELGLRAVFWGAAVLFLALPLLFRNPRTPGKPTAA
jgi:DHA1 family multidrug resistance protein-like MFS transporter